MSCSSFLDSRQSIWFCFISTELNALFLCREAWLKDKTSKSRNGRLSLPDSDHRRVCHNRLGLQRR